MPPCSSAIRRPFMSKARRLLGIGCCYASLVNAFQLHPSFSSSASCWIGSAAKIPQTPYHINWVASARACSSENLAPRQQLQLQPLGQQGLHHDHSRQRHLRCNGLRCHSSPDENSSRSNNDSSGGGNGGDCMNDSSPTPSSPPATRQQSTGIGSNLVENDALRRTERRGSAQSEKKFISRISRRLADSFPLLTAEEIKSGVQSLLEPDMTKPETKV